MNGTADSTDLFPGVLTSAQFDALAAQHRHTTGFKLCAIDANGSLLRGCSKRDSCAKDGACQPFRAQAIAEAMRWGEPCVLCCSCDRALWAVPVIHNQRVCGGLLVASVALNRPRRRGTLDQKILQACRALLDLATQHNLTNAAQLAERRQFAHRESERAEAIHALKDRLHDDIRRDATARLSIAATLGIGRFVAQRRYAATMLAGSLGSSFVFFVATNTVAWADDAFYPGTLTGW